MGESPAGNVTITLNATDAVLEVEDVWVRVEKRFGDRSHVRIRVGTFASADNARRARLIAEELHHQLGLDPPVFDAPDDEQGAPGDR